MQIYKATDELETALKDGEFAAAIVQINIMENEIALVFFRNNLKTILLAGTYFYFKGLAAFEVKQYDLNEAREITDIDKAIINSQALSQDVTSFQVEKYEKALLFQDGTLVKELNGGNYSFWKGAKKVEVLKVDLRLATLEISGQEILTKDKAAIRINFQLEYRVVDIFKALLENKDYYKQLYNQGQLSLREAVSAISLDELLDSKEKIGAEMILSLQNNAKKLGVEVLTAGIRDIILPGDVKDIMNQVLIAEKRAQANAIARREELASTRNMLNTAKLMEDNTILYKLKEMEYVERVAEKISEIKLSNGEPFAQQLAQILAK